MKSLKVLMVAAALTVVSFIGCSDVEESVTSPSTSGKGNTIQTGNGSGNTNGGSNSITRTFNYQIIDNYNGTFTFDVTGTRTAGTDVQQVKGKIWTVQLLKDNASYQTWTVGASNQQNCYWGFTTSNSQNNRITTGVLPAGSYALQVSYYHGGAGGNGANSCAPSISGEYNIYATTNPPAAQPIGFTISEPAFTLITPATDATEGTFNVGIGSITAGANTTASAKTLGYEIWKTTANEVAPDVTNSANLVDDNLSNSSTCQSSLTESYAFTTGWYAVRVNNFNAYGCNGTSYTTIYTNSPASGWQWFYVAPAPSIGGGGNNEPCMDFEVTPSLVVWCKNSAGTQAKITVTFTVNACRNMSNMVLEGSLANRISGSSYTATGNGTFSMEPGSGHADGSWTNVTLTEGNNVFTVEYTTSVNTNSQRTPSIEEGWQLKESGSNSPLENAQSIAGVSTTNASTCP